MSILGNTILSSKRPAASQCEEACQPRTFQTDGAVQESPTSSFSSQLCRNFVDRVASELKQHLCLPWITVSGDEGLYILLLSRDQERILLQVKTDTIGCIGEQGCNDFVQRVINVVRRLKSYEVCVGVDETEYKSLWDIDQHGTIDTNPYGELRYKETFRPLGCLLLVSTDKGYIKLRERFPET